MFDVSLSSKLSTTVSFNAVSGTLVKSCPESRIVRFHRDSDRAEAFFDIKDPRTQKNSWDAPEKVIVLQVMLSGENYYLVEFLIKEESDL